MDKCAIKIRKNFRYISEYLDCLIKKAVSAGMQDPKIENEIKELNDMLKALDHRAQSCRSEIDHD